MSEETIVPFVSAAAKRAHDASQAAGDDEGVKKTIEQLLGALEGMENEIHGMLQIIADQDKRIRALEKAGKSKIIRGVA